MKQSRLKRSGFTLIELLVVVGLIAILSSLLIVGIGKLQTNAKRQQTVQLLENCRAMWAEYDSVNRMRIDQFPVSSPGNVTLEAETQAESQATSNPVFGERTGYTVVLTRTIFSLMRSQPNIRTEMDKFPSGRMFLTTLQSSPQIFGHLYGGVQYTSNTAYTAGSFVNYTDPATGLVSGYYCIHTPIPDPSGNYPPTPPPTDTGYWIPLMNEPTDPVLLDGWGNPVICCIGAQLGGITPQGVPIPSLPINGVVPQGAVVVGGKWASGSTYQGGAYVSGQVVAGSGARTIIVSSPDKRIFFASSGPDGDFSKGDDNIYSFEKP